MLKNKSDAFEKLQDFLKEIGNQFGRKIKRIRSDRGYEYESSAFNSFELTKAMLIESGAPIHFWSEAILIACQVLNKVPHKKSHTTHFEMWK